MLASLALESRDARTHSIRCRTLGLNSIRYFRIIGQTAPSIKHLGEGITEGDTLEEAFGHPSSTITARERIVEPAGECLDDREVAIEIGRRRGKDVSPWDSVPESPVRTPGLFEKFPLIYTHDQIHGYRHSEGRQIKRLRQLNPAPCHQMNPERATGSCWRLPRRQEREKEARQ